MGDRAGAHWQWAAGQPVTAIVLDMYELVNLRAAIEAIGYPWPGDDGESPLAVLNSGDWLGQIYLKLPDPKELEQYEVGRNGRIPPPNSTPENYRKAARVRAARKADER